MEATNQVLWVQCPYDPNHVLMKSRMPMHLIRCRKNHQDIKLEVCPYDSSHFVKAGTLEDHINFTCKASKKFLAKEFMEPVTAAPLQKPLVVTEDWDKEAPVAAYDPEKYCKTNNIIRSIQGESRTVRRKFRESERKRLGSKTK